MSRIREAREMIVNDTFNPTLNKYVGRFNLFTLTREERTAEFWESGDGYKIKNQPIQFLYEHRYEVAHLFDVFLDWSDAQMKCYCNTGEGRMFNIQGP